MAILRKPRGRLARAVVRTTLLTLIVLEFSLQAIALGVWVFYPRPSTPAPTAGESVVLCLGDSYTFGMGASDFAHSYPAQLGTIIAEHDDCWTVVNEGWPGHKSRDLLQQLDAQFERLGLDRKSLDELSPNIIGLQLKGEKDKIKKPS